LSGFPAFRQSHSAPPPIGGQRRRRVFSTQQLARGQGQNRFKTTNRAAARGFNTVIGSLEGQQGKERDYETGF